MSLMGLGITPAGQYCHMCRSSHCQHIMGNAQQMSNELYNDMIRQYGAQQQGIAISSGSLTAGNITTTEKSITIGDLPKPNRKLLLLME